MNDQNNNNKPVEELGSNPAVQENLALDDERRVKVLSPGAMVAKRFFRNRIAVVGLVILVAMFLFSFVGGIVSPYDEAELFYTETLQKKEYAGAVKNEDMRFLAADGQEFGSIIQAQVVLAITTHKDVASYRDVNYHVTQEGKDLYSVSLDDGTVIGIGYKDVLTSSVEGQKLGFDFTFAALKAYANNE